MKKENRPGKGNSSNDGEKQAGKSKLQFAQKVTLRELLVVALRTAAPRELNWRQALDAVRCMFVQAPSGADVCAALDELVAKCGTAERVDNGWRLKQSAVPAHDGEQRSGGMSAEVKAHFEELNRLDDSIIRAVGLLQLIPEQLWRLAHDHMDDEAKEIAESLAFVGNDSADLLKSASQATWDSFRRIRVLDQAKGGAK